MAWLGGEPQVWAMGVVLVIGVARARGPVMVGLALGFAIVSVQMVPFLVWVAEGDRGPAAAAWALRGALAPADWSGLLVPKAGSAGGRMVYAESLFLGAPVLVCALLGGWRREVCVRPGRDRSEHGRGEHDAQAWREPHDRKNRGFRPAGQPW